MSFNINKIQSGKNVFDKLYDAAVINLDTAMKRRFCHRLFSHCIHELVLYNEQKIEEEQ